MKRIHTWALAAAAVLTCADAGCGGTVHRAQGVEATRVAADGVPLHVVNNNPEDMKIFVVVDGTWKYVGFVAGRSSASFDLADLEWTGAPLRMLATPVGGQGQARPDPLTVLPGHTVTFTIGADLALSSAIVR